MELSNAEWKIIDSIVNDIYTEKDIYKLRINFLNRLNELINHKISFFDLGYRKGNQVVFFDPVTTTLSKTFLVSYYRDYESVDVMSWFFMQNDIQVFRETDYVTDSIRTKNKIYTECLAQQGCYYGMGSMVAKNQVLFGSVNLWRALGESDFTDKELYILEVLNKHLGSAFMNQFPGGIKRNSVNEYSDSFSHVYGLTKREAEIADMLYEGMTTKEISERLVITENTTKKHIQNIFNKMNISSKAQLLKIIYNYMTSYRESSG